MHGFHTKYMNGFSSVSKLASCLLDRFVEERVSDDLFELLNRLAIPVELDHW